MVWPICNPGLRRVALASLVALLALWVCTACGPKRYQLPPETIRSDGQSAPIEQSGDVVPDLPPGELFRLGYDAFSHSERERALAYFTALLERHPESPEFSDAAYNAGLLLQKLNRHAEAVTRFEQVAAHARHPRDITDARFRILLSLDELGRWTETLDLVQQMSAIRSTYSPDDDLELRMRRGVALYHLKRLDEAETELTALFHDYEIGLRREEVVNEVAGAAAAYYMGMIFRARFDAVALVLAEKQQMLAQMELRARHLQSAQDWFLACIRQDNVTWATAAGLQIGNLYRDFFTAIRDVPIPDDIAGEEEILMYRCILFEQVKVLLRKAMRIYEHTLDIGLRLRVRNRFTEQTQADLREVENLYLEEEKACEEVLPAEPIPSGRLP
jgi:hypothetical protein